ncbi:cytochrome c oxidase subunit 2 [Ekhidna lutea]|uniref:Cytochrome c oxidase subunit 2 n=1 Tax=Ekhidna lutea TaxID=447679 RepID=A0A239HBT8_EKHLU|nr:cytochrome c oxidase subunit II [Ekhidna lutea]SNS78820.1 cytochrome c oxidase subunit 2 [Ekhidna lutea]
MLNLIIVIAVVLIIAVIFTAYRVTTLVDVVKKKKSDSHVPPGNNFQGVLMILFLVGGIAAFFYFSMKEYDTYNLPIASEHAVITENLFWITMAITVFVFIVTQIFLFGFSYKYRHKENYQAHYYPHNNKLEMIWTIIPAIVLAWLIISGLKQWSVITGPAPDNAEVIEVMGYQYAWAFRYPGKDGELGSSDFRKIDAVNSMGIDLEDQRGHDDFMPTQLVLPKGKPVLLKIRGRDVIHSVYNPHFRMQMNAVPGMPTQFWFTPSVSTAEMREITDNPEFNYELVCNKICGKSHYGMKGLITVLEQDEYDSWYKETQENTFLKQNPGYLSEVPEELKEAAKIAAGIENIENEQKVTSAASSSK